MPASFALTSSTAFNDDYVIEITDCFLTLTWVDLQALSFKVAKKGKCDSLKIELNNTLLGIHGSKSLSSHSFLFDEWSVKPFTLPPFIHGHTGTLIEDNEIPDLALLVFVDEDAFDSSMKHVPFLLEHLNINFVQFTLGHKPVKDIKCTIIDNISIADSTKCA